ncbi:MAG: SCO family protein, partial [Chitinophagales bacterium]
EYGVIPGKWNLLTGDRDKLFYMARKGFKLSAADQKDGESEIIHSDRFVLVDPNGNIRGFYIGTDEDAVKHLKGDLALLLTEYKKK